MRIGVSNAALLDLNTGNLSGNCGSVVIDPDLLEKIVFIKEGQFVETGGTPTLRVIGNVTEIATGKVVLAEPSKKVVKAIEPNDIINAFLEGQPVEEPLEYVKRIISATSANYPIYFFLQQSKTSISDAINFIKKSTTRGNMKSKLIERLEGKYISVRKMPKKDTEASEKRKMYRDYWISEKMPFEIDDLYRCIDAILYLTNDEIKEHKKYICETMKNIFINYYADAKNNEATNMRIAISRIDEALYNEV